MDERADGFLSRWARRKAQARTGEAVAPEPVPAAAAPVAAPILPAAEVATLEPPLPEVAPAAEPLPTMADVAQLTCESDYSRFVSAGVDEDVKRAAMKKLFSDPHFNVMDGLDTYIDDYGKPDPIPLAMLRQMNQSKFLRLFEDDDEDDTKKSPELLAAAPVTEPKTTPDDDSDLRLQQDHAAGRPGPEQGAGA